MKIRMIACILMIVLLLPCILSAAVTAEEDIPATVAETSGTFVANNNGATFSWVWDDTLKTLTVSAVSGTGKLSGFSTAEELPWNAYRSEIEKIILKPGIITIGNYAFESCTQLKYVEIPRSITAFYVSSFKDSQENATFLYSGSKTEWENITKKGTDAYTTTDIRCAPIKSTQLLLGETLIVRFHVFVAKEKLESYDSAEMNFTLQTEAGDITATAIPTYPQDGEDWCYFDFKGLAPQYMGCNLKAALKLNGTTTLSSQDTYSVLGYCQDLVSANSNDAKLCALVADLLEYGAAAQKYKGYDVDHLVNAAGNWTDIDKPLPSVYTDIEMTRAKPVTVNGNASVGFVSAGVYFSNNNKLYFKFRGDENTKILINDVEVTVASVPEEAGVYVAYTDGISADQLFNTYTVKLYCGDTPVQTLEYSVKAYVYAMQQDNVSDEMKALAKALYCYGMSANNYMS